MHYSFAYKGSYIINDKYADIALPMYGLVESCFSGLSYEVFLNKVNDNLDVIAETIEGLLVLNTDHLKKL